MSINTQKIKRNKEFWLHRLTLLAVNNYCFPTYCFSIISKAPFYNLQTLGTSSIKTK